uniref:FAD dependent oxidoreductase domain-containing protein n=1 Tax=Myotis lucifugus TaxID=59463 RepID=G1PYW9_MYOLU
VMFYRLLSVVQRQRTSRGWQNWPSARSGASAAEAHSVALPAQAQVVICGGGIMGTSVAYHLSKMGWKDIVLLEQGSVARSMRRITGGNPVLGFVWHLGIEQKMDYSNKLYQQLEQKQGSKQVSRVCHFLLCPSPDSVAGTVCVPQKLAWPSLFPTLHKMNQNRVHVIGSCSIGPDTSALPGLASLRWCDSTGIRIYDRTSVIHVMIKKGEVTGVETDKGQIECQYFVNCAGQV